MTLSSDLLCIPDADADADADSFFSRTNSLSLDSNSFDFISEKSNNQQEQEQEQEHGEQEHGEQQNPSNELLTALTRHLVMPRLPILSNYNSNSTATSPSPSPLQIQKSHSSSSSSKKSSSHSSIIPARILVVGDAHSAHGLGSLDSHLSSLAPFPNHLDRASDILPQFKLSDPSTYDALVQYIESPFIRLKEILNPKFFYRHHHSSLPAPTRDDLINVVNAWIEREGYLLLLIEVATFPLSAEKLEFILTLSRLIPTIPFLPNEIPLKKAMDGQAIVTRQLISKRIRHFSIPKANHYQSFMFPNREECLVRSSKCFLDWLTVEYATCRNLDIQHGYPATDQDFTIITPSARESEDDYFELDRWSEQVSLQAKRRNLKDPPLPPDNHDDRRPRSSDQDDYEKMVLLEEIIKIQQQDKKQIEYNKEMKKLESWISFDSFGLPSLTGLFKLGLIEIQLFLKQIYSSYCCCFFISFKKGINKRQHKNYDSFNQHDQSYNLLKSNNKNNKKKKKKEKSKKSIISQSNDHVSTITISEIQNLNQNKSPQLFLLHQSQPHSKHHHINNNGNNGSTATWFFIGFMTAATISVSVWYRNKFVLF